MFLFLTSKTSIQYNNGNDNSAETASLIPKYCTVVTCYYTIILFSKRSKTPPKLTSAPHHLLLTTPPCNLHCSSHYSTGPRRSTSLHTPPTGLPPLAHIWLAGVQQSKAAPYVVHWKCGQHKGKARVAGGGICQKGPLNMRWNMQEYGGKK